MVDFNNVIDFIYRLQEEGTLIVEDEDDLILAVEEFIENDIESRYNSLLDDE